MPIEKRAATPLTLCVVCVAFGLLCVLFLSRDVCRLAQKRALLRLCPRFLVKDALFVICCAQATFAVCMARVRISQSRRIPVLNWHIKGRLVYIHYHRRQLRLNSCQAACCLWGLVLFCFAWDSLASMGVSLSNAKGAVMQR